MIPTTDHLIGRLVRLPLRLIPDGRTVRILSGPGRGMRWVTGTFDHGCWIGTYERTVAQTLAELIGPESVVADVGAHVGYYTLIAGRRARLVHAIEPSAANVGHLRRHVALNGLTNVHVIEAAVADVDGEAPFSEGASSAQGALSDEGTTVRTTTLDSLDPAPTVLKIDVEGAELRVLDGATRLLSEHKPAVVLATHGEALHRACAERLRGHGYNAREINTETLLAT